MKNWKVIPSKLKGTLSVPPSKSQSMRALLFGMLAKGKSVLTNLLPSPDMIRACRLLGAIVDEYADRVEITGLNGKLDGAEDVIDAGNSGLILRLVGAVAALSSKPIVLTGDHSIRHYRPVVPLLKGLNQLGATAISLRENGKAPIFVKGPLQSGHVVIDGEDSQPVSGLLIASAFAPGPVEISVNNPGELPWVGLTLNWLDRLGISYAARDGVYYSLEGRASIEGFSYHVPADFSSLAFPLAAALLTDSEVHFEDLDFRDPQGDKILIEILRKMGGRIEIEEGAVRVKKGNVLQGKKIDVNSCIDALPILAVVGCFAEGETELVGAAIARKKECDRIAAISTELKKMGAAIEQREDGLLIRRSPLHGCAVRSYNDHRIALSLAVAGLSARGETVINDVACVAKTYPEFRSQMNLLGADIQ
ncbi:MAG: 3-phosphoshikimate 1-carboxyvinyltransferase [Chlamydiales bacterium]|nr:3-phosphoshikimate 1-carboxyvinyltransferase [Chlamydiales bacterium]